MAGEQAPPAAPPPPPTPPLFPPPCGGAFPPSAPIVRSRAPLWSMLPPAPGDGCASGLGACHDLRLPLPLAPRERLRPPLLRPRLWPDPRRDRRGRRLRRIRGDGQRR